MSKPNRLQDALKAKADGPEITARPAKAMPPQPSTEPSSRSGKIMVSAYMPKEVRGSFRLIQAQRPDKQMQELIASEVDSKVKTTIGARLMLKSKCEIPGLKKAVT